MLIINKPIVLVGIMGVGKTSFGKKFAKNMKLSFFDSDDEIEKKENMSVSEIFAKKGESYFRHKEEIVIKKLLDFRKPCVIALGGGAFVNEKIRQVVKEKAISVLIKADIDILLKRVSENKRRPLLAKGNKKEILSKLLKEREPFYCLADIEIENNNYPYKKLEETLLKILEKQNYSITEKKIQLDLGDRSYDIIISSGIINKSGELIKKHTKNGKVFIVTDDNVAKHHLDKFEKILAKSNINFTSIILPHGESTKSFDNLEKILGKILSYKPDRNATLIAFGGGVIGDITGLAASLLLRGVNFIQIPTTLLAMVDSSVGGKTGINSKYGKNLIGSFYQPKIVIADIELLQTLPVRELRAGYAEVLKYALINDKPFFEFLESDNNPFMKDNIIIDTKTSDFISEIVMTSCKSKADIVNQDEKEGSVRALLNLGHSFGHALEAELEYDGRLLHGEAIAIGMIMAFNFSNKIGLCSIDDVKKVKNHIEKAYLPVGVNRINENFSSDTIVNRMMHDKKNQDGNLVLILVNGIGEAYIEKSVQASEVKSFLNDYFLS